MKIALLNILIGFAVAAVGIGVSVGSYAMVSRGGGHYVVAWGAVLVGGWRVIVGLFQLVRAFFQPDGRAAFARLVWPREKQGRLVRVIVAVVAVAAALLVAPESWTTFSSPPSASFGASREVKSIAFSPDGRWMALGLGYGGLSVIDAKTGAAGKTPTLDPYSDIEAVAFSPDGKSLAAVAYNGLRVWTSADWGRSDPTLLIKSSTGDYGVAFSPDGATLATGSISNGLQVWDMKSRTVKWRSGSQRSVHGVAFSADGRSIASGEDGGGVQIRDAESGKLLRALSTSGAGIRLFTTIAFLPDGRVAAASYEQPGVLLWDSRSGTLLRTFRSTSRLWGGGTVWSIGVAPGGRWIVGGQSDGSIRFWEMQRDGPVRTIFAHAKDVRSVAVSPHGARIASGGSDMAVKIYAAP